MMPPAISAPSPNCGPRRGGAVPDLVVLHYTAMGSAQAALDRLRDPSAEVSAHWLIGRDGVLWHLVDEADRAWHAGAGAWGAVTDVNSRSIGIEIDNDGRSPFSEPAMTVLENLLSGIMERWTVSPERVIGHSDMAPGRKADPGPRFDWERLSRQGLAVARSSPPDDPTPVDADMLAPALARIGYTAPSGFDACLSAFRLRHRPRAHGPATRTDLTLAEHLARTYPVDRVGTDA